MQTANYTRFKAQIIKIFWITVAWTLVSIFQFFFIYSALINTNCDLTGRDPMIPFLGSLLTGVLAGIFGGTAVTFSWEKWLRTTKYSRALINIILSYSLVYLMVAIPTGLFNSAEHLDTSLRDEGLWKIIIANNFQLTQIVSYLFWLFVVLATLIVLLVNDKYGPGVFRSFLLGKYFQPKREERIFMFLDLRSSTTIAEKLGEERNFRFINDVFRVATPSILYSKGEIYQYVGDEIIVSWEMERGSENANCINCFFEIQQALNEKRSYFEELYGVRPEFKAGLHYGYVMAGEVGVVKRDIAYSGDVLNTASRIQSKCNDLGVNILFSKLLLDKLNMAKHSFVPKEIGQMELRGKEERVMLITV